MISDLHSRQFFAKHFTKTQKFGVEGWAPTLLADKAGGPRSPQAKPGWQAAWAGDENEPISHPECLRRGITEASDGEGGSPVTPVSPHGICAHQVGGSMKPQQPAQKVNADKQRELILSLAPPSCF